MIQAVQFVNSLAADVRAELTASPKSLPPKYFYDTRGSALFDEITRLPEYYLTRAERGLLTRHADEIASSTRAETLIELGSGTSDKTRLLLDALQRRGTLRRFVPVDIDADMLAEASACVAAEYPGLDVQPVVGDFERHEAFLAPGRRRLLLAFLGSTIGNLEPARRASFVARVRASLSAGDAFPLGTDLVKDPARLIAPTVTRRVSPRCSTAMCSPSSIVSSVPVFSSTHLSTSRCGTRRTSGLRCGCGPSAARSSTSRLST